MARPTARRSALRSESHMSRALTPSERTRRTASFRLRIRAAPGSTPAVDRSMLLRVRVAALRLVRLPVPLSRDAVLAGEPAPEIDRPASGRTERERRVLLARLHLRAAGETAGHAVFVDADAPDFKRVPRDSGSTKD